VRIVEFNRDFPLISDTAKKRTCLRAIVSWAATPVGEQVPDPGTLK